MQAFTEENMGVAMEGDGLEIRLADAGEMTVGLFLSRPGPTCARC